MSEVDPLIGRMLLGRYRVVGRLAQGGMGVVYLARLEGAAGFTKPVVLKRILPDLEQKEMMGMFVREARILGKLRHPNIASILDFSEEDGANVMVLEYVHGYDVGHWRRYVRSARGSFDLEIALYIVVSVLEALAHAHHLVQPDGSITQIVHRDISPSNVLVDTEGHVKLLDFGVARMLGGESGLYKTAEITIKGKIPYVAPELLQGGTPSPQGDVYACAVVLHELLVGRNELRGNDMNDTVLRVFSHVPCPISEVRDDVPPELDAILARQLSKSPEVRLQTANEFASALRSIQKLAPDELRRRLVAQLREDYEAMPAATGVTPLADRERAWRIPTETLIARELDTEPNVGGPPSSLPPTVAEGKRQDRSATSATPATRKSRWPVAAALLGAFLLAGVAAVVVPRLLTPAPPEQIFVVQHQDPLEDDEPLRGGDPVAPVTDAGVAAIPEPQSEPSGEPESEPRPEPARPRPARGAPLPGESLSASFARHRRDVEDCLRRHASQIEGAPELSVRFEVERDGRVRAAHVLPAAIEPTPLGACLAGVARGVRFAEQERDGVSFRIPITVARQ